MLRNKYILLIFLFLIGAQWIASQVVVLDSVDVIDSIDKIDSIEFLDTVELADAEFEAWLEEYAHITDSSLQITDDSLLVEVVQDTIKKKDFVSLSKEGEEAREREKNALIMSVMKSFKVRSEELGVRSESSDSSVMYNLTDSAVTLYSSSVCRDARFERPQVKADEVDNFQLLTLNYQLSTFNSPDSLLVEVDSTLSQIKTQNIASLQFSANVNPMFLDWVLGAKSAVSVSFTDDDSVIVEVRTHAKDYVRATAPELYAYHKSQLPSISELQVGRIQYDKRDKLLLNLDSLNRNKTSKLNVDLPEMPKWNKGAKFQVHASQNYISSNWYKGGESNMAATLYAMGYFNYDNRKGLQWDNKAEWKLGLYGMASDSLRWLRVNEDLLRLNSKLGYKAFKNFYYTAEWDFQTSLFNTYKSNTYIRTSGPFSPIRMSLSLGMDYKWKNYVSVFVSPLSYKLVYVADMSYKEGVLPEENIAYQVGITDGTRQSNQLGALIRTDFDYDFNESIGMEVHFSFFGNYVGKIKGVEVGCEVIGNFKINRFLSAKVSLYPRYDSTTLPADGGKPKMQFYELISLGFNYKL